MVCSHSWTLLLSLLGVATVYAHKEPKTDAEIETQRALQRAAYYVRCATFNTTIITYSDGKPSSTPQIGEKILITIVSRTSCM
ncbi:hypothetical protein F5878DRAFT_634741 [Lentinula raphanica]|uniref:Uncharacterized protein n=1 Tax=Lentinula raphanica TaxID=153919 RepID=A0AA38NY03_9AGAR|nr:hypothetical protein F5878DRAFT_634741 [Lentinula raphanica]